MWNSATIFCTSLRVELNAGEFHHLFIRMYTTQKEINSALNLISPANRMKKLARPVCSFLLVSELI